MAGVKSLLISSLLAIHIACFAVSADAQPGTATNLDCLVSQFRCDNGMCIDREQLCDGEENCEQGEDEQDQYCYERNCKQPDAFHCMANYCIERAEVCNGLKDCPNGIDEANCSSSAVQSFKCSSEEFACVRSKECVLNSYRCDGNEDCPLGEDEEDCKSSSSTCAADNFRCVSDGLCLPNAKHCDGTADCVDESDEIGCSRRNTTVSHCQADEFACRSTGLELGPCLPLVRRCDKFVDCPLADDEEGCKATVDSAIKFDSNPTFICDRATQFKCGKTDTCVNKASICDSVVDCPSGEDEQNCQLDSDSDPCTPSNLGRCDHACVPLHNSTNGRTRYTCGCNPGFRLAGPYMCTNVNECLADVSPCSHRCEDTIGSFRCSCNAPYTLDAADQRTCRAASGEGMLLLLAGDELRAQRFDSTGNYVSLRNLTEATSFDVDASSQLVFWSTQSRSRHASRKSGIYMTNWVPQSTDSRQQDQLRRKIDEFLRNMPASNTEGLTSERLARARQAETVQSEVKGFMNRLKGEAKLNDAVVTLVEDPAAEIQSIAYDWLNHVIYWADANRRHIAALSLLSGRSRVIITGLYAPRALALDPAFGTLYFIDGYDNTATINSVGLDGSERVVILDSQSVSEPQSLTVDHSSRRLFFSDAKRGLIGLCSIGVAPEAVGSTCRQLKSFSAASTTQGISTFEDQLYWVHGRFGAVNSCGRSACSLSERQILSDAANIRGVSVLHPLRQPADAVSGCAAGGKCPFMCLPTRRFEGSSMSMPNARCVCDHGEQYVAGSSLFSGKCVADQAKSSSPVSDSVNYDAADTGAFDVGRLAIIVGTILGVVIVGILITVCIYRNYSNRNGKSMSMNFENPVYGKPIAIAVPLPQFRSNARSTSMVDVVGDADVDGEAEGDIDLEGVSDGSRSYTASPLRRPTMHAVDASETRCLTESNAETQQS